MDPCPFVRVLVGNLAIRAPAADRPARGAGIHPSAHPCFATVRLENHPSCHTAPVPLLPAEHGTDAPPPASALALAARFHLSKLEIGRLNGKSLFSSSLAADTGTAKLKVAIYSGRRGATCGVRSRRLLGKVSLPLDLRAVAEGRAVVFQSGWVPLGKSAKPELYLTVLAEADPRFVFEFEGEPQDSSQVFQVEGHRRQPVFTCTFSCRHHSSDRIWGSRSTQPEPSSSRMRLSSFGSDREWPGKERKGWSVTVHDLSGSPVALASMVTPFVASPGTDRVSRSNPGAWLILRPDDGGTWQPWGRLEAWRERGSPSGDGLGYRFDLIADAPGSPGITLAESTISASKGGKFAIDLTGATGNPLARTNSSPRRSGELPPPGYRGFVMSSTVAGEGRTGARTAVEVGVQHVGCSEDAAAFVAVAAAMNLSMDACRLFSSKLRRGFSSSALLRRSSAV